MMHHGGNAVEPVCGASLAILASFVHSATAYGIASDVVHAAAYGAIGAISGYFTKLLIERYHTRKTKNRK